MHPIIILVYLIEETGQPREKYKNTEYIYNLNNTVALVEIKSRIPVQAIVITTTTILKIHRLLLALDMKPHSWQLITAVGKRSYRSAVYLVAVLLHSLFIGTYQQFILEMCSDSRSLQ